jgi:hypothetical protein
VRRGGPTSRGRSRAGGTTYAAQDPEAEGGDAEQDDQAPGTGPGACQSADEHARRGRQETGRGRAGALCSVRRPMKPGARDARFSQKMQPGEADPGRPLHEQAEQREHARVREGRGQPRDDHACPCVPVEQRGLDEQERHRQEQHGHHGRHDTRSVDPASIERAREAVGDGLVFDLLAQHAAAEEEREQWHHPDEDLLGGFSRGDPATEAHHQVTEDTRGGPPSKGPLLEVPAGVELRPEEREGQGGGGVSHRASGIGRGSPGRRPER